MPEFYTATQYRRELFFILMVRALSTLRGVAKTKTVTERRSNYWSSTENSSANAWNLNFNNGNRWNNSKASGQYRVRAVSAFLQ